MFSVFEFLQHATIKIKVLLENGNEAFGTGFLFQFQYPNDLFLNVLVTNKHVIENAVRGMIRVTYLLPDGQKPNFEDIEDIIIDDFEASWIDHPDTAVDLCVLPFDPILGHLGAENGKKVCFTPLREKELPDYADTGIYKPTEEIHMVGYPNGLGDDKHNLPLVRKGITATPFFIAHNGIDEFMVDCACFPGSSGSPVLIANEGSYSLHKRPLQAGNRIVLLGILYAGPMYDKSGQFKKFNVPTANVPQTDIPMNLGYCIPAIKLLDFKSILSDRINRSNPN